MVEDMFILCFSFLLLGICFVWKDHFQSLLLNIFFWRHFGLGTLHSLLFLFEHCLYLVSFNDFAQKSYCFSCYWGSCAKLYSFLEIQSTKTTKTGSIKQWNVFIIDITGGNMLLTLPWQCASLGWVEINGQQEDYFVSIPWNIWQKSMFNQRRWE